ncbi:MAG: hypothetical protein AAF747_02750 [Planctomycetota bacterium]
MKPASGMSARYEEVRRLMLARYVVRVRKWRSSTSGVAWQLTYQDGSVSRLIESPKPTGPVSVAVFLHEIGHHAIGFGRFRPRCLEEYHAWAFAFWQMREHELNITDRVRQRCADALLYAVAKARRRGLKQVPGELAQYLIAVDAQGVGAGDALLIASAKRADAEARTAGSDGDACGGVEVG